MDKRKVITDIRRSCLMGNVVWIYQGPSQEAARKAYARACKKEVERVRLWPEHQRRRAELISGFIDGLLSGLPITAELTDAQKDAVRQLQAVMRKAPECHMEFYDHIVEEARRRNWASRRWLRNRVEKFGPGSDPNRDYGKRGG